MFKFSGVTIDFYDDHGETLKQKFPTADQLPDIIKTADVKPKDKLANEQFAVVMLDGGTTIRKLACHDAGTTAMSTIYFMEHGHKLPEEAQKVAAARLTESCLQFGMEPPKALVEKTASWRGFLESLERRPPGFLWHKAKGPEKVMELASKAERKITKGIPRPSHKDINPELTKVLRIAQDKALERAGLSHRVASEMRAQARRRLGHAAGVPSLGYEPELNRALEALPIGKHVKTGSIVDVTGQKAPPQIKTAMPQGDNDYAVILPDGERHYPIDTWDRVKTAEQYWLDNARRMDPEIKRQYAVKLAAKAHTIGYPVDELIVESGSTSMAPYGHLRAAIEMRKVACSPGEDRDFLDGLLEKSASVKPEVYAEVLRRFDVEHGFDNGWGHIILDPWESTYSNVKTAAIVWENGADRVTDLELQNLARNRVEILSQVFSMDFVNEFTKDPVGVFKSLPNPQKRYVARLAFDASHQGEAEAGPNEMGTDRQ